MVQKRKAVTPVIAVVLLLMMTVAVGGVAFMWLTKMQEDMQDDISKQQEEMRKKATAGLTIAAVWNSSNTNDISILLRNSGSYTFSGSEINNTEVYYDGKYMDKVKNFFNGSSTTCNVSLAPGESCVAETGKKLWPVGVGDEFTIRLDEPTTGVKVTKYCRINEADQDSC